MRVEQFASFNSNTGEEVSTPFVTGPLVELGDGTLLAANYGKFVGDAARAPGFEREKGKYFRNRTYLLASRDGGTQWSYLATVAYDGRTGQESFCEPSLVDLGNGELLAVMRTGHFAPLYQARSKDGGKSWGEPESLHVPGLSPPAGPARQRRAHMQLRLASDEGKFVLRGCPRRLPGSLQDRLRY